MSTAIAMAPSPAPHDARSSYVDIAPSASSTTLHVNSSPVHRHSNSASATPNHPSRIGSGSPKATSTPVAGRGSPNLSRSGNNIPPKIFVKKEPPSSPDLPTSRHRPRKLDLSIQKPAGPNTSRPSAGQLTSRDSSGLGIQDVGLACLSPGFQTQDPTMREQLQRSISVREQQRHIIESRLQQTAKPGDAPMESAKESSVFANIGGDRERGPKTGTRRKAPPGLSIVAPSHEQFANERVIQSAPLHSNFPGRHQQHPLTRHTQNQPSNLSNTSHIHHVPATQTVNRLPPITDVFAAEGLGNHRESNNGSRNSFFPQTASASNSSHSNARPNFPSPGHQVSSNNIPQSATRPREYRSAEEAQVELAGGRPELLPKLVHYGSHHTQQPPSPPSPRGRRRGRQEYEEGTSPREEGRRVRTGPFGEGRDSEEEQKRKKEEFIKLCDRAWDLFHS